MKVCEIKAFEYYPYPGVEQVNVAAFSTLLSNAYFMWGRRARPDPAPASPSASASYKAPWEELTLLGFSYIIHK